MKHNLTTCTCIDGSTAMHWRCIHLHCGNTSDCVHARIVGKCPISVVDYYLRSTKLLLWPWVPPVVKWTFFWCWQVTTCVRIPVKGQRLFLFFFCKNNCFSMESRFILDKMNGMRRKLKQRTSIQKVSSYKTSICTANKRIFKRNFNCMMNCWQPSKNLLDLGDREVGC